MMSTRLPPRFSVPESMLTEVDSRPMVDVTVDLTESCGILSTRLSEMALSSASVLDDSTAQYIEALLVETIASPFPLSNRGSIKNFFHSSVHGQVDDVLNEVKDAICLEISDAEKFTELVLGGESIHPDKVRPTILKRHGRFITLAYRIGRDPAETAVEPTDGECGEIDDEFDDDNSLE